MKLNGNRDLDDMSSPAMIESNKVWVEQQLSSNMYRRMAGQPFGNDIFVAAVVKGILPSVSDSNATRLQAFTLDQLAFVSFKVGDIVVITSTL